LAYIHPHLVGFSGPSEASWLGQHFLDNSRDLNLLNNFSMSRVAKSTDYSKAVIFIHQTESSRAYTSYLARSLSEYARGSQGRKLLTIDSNLAKQSSRDSSDFLENVQYCLLYVSLQEDLISDDP
jgi:hypothetical protein